MDLALPCHCVFPPVQREIELFQPGLRFKSDAGETLASINVTPESRYEPRGLARWLGIYKGRHFFDPRRFELIMTVGTQPTWSLRGWASAWGNVTQNEVFTANGDAAGKIVVKRQAFRMWSDSTRVTFCDEAGTEIGSYAQSMTPMSGQFVFVDHVRSWEYRLEYNRKTGGDQAIVSDQTDVIDARIVLAFGYYARFYDNGES